MKNRKKLKPGERVFSFLFLGVSLWLLYQSIQMLKKAPEITSFGAMPFALSVIMIVCMLYVIFVEDFKAITENAGDTFLEKVRSALHYVLPLDVVVFLLLLVTYIGMLLVGAGFLVSSALFMLATMTYLMPKDLKTIKNNVLFTLLLLAIIYIVFQLIFKVTLP